MCIRVFLLLLSIISFKSAFCQTATISGYIADSETGEKLIGVVIYETNSRKAVTSNSYGFYSLTLQSNDSIKLTISLTGYATASYTALLKDNGHINFDLKPGLILSEAVISNEIPANKRNEMGMASIPIKQINKLPALGGEPDLMKALQLMPGIKQGNEGSGGLYVRGGSPDQNLMFLDDVPLYYVNHLGGFVSVFNTDAINHVNVIKGGFPARYGSRLSSIVDVRMKEGNMKKYQVSGMLGLLASKISVEGPIKKDTTSFIVSARRMLLDLITRPLTESGIGYYFYDLNAKINHKISFRDQLFFSFYMGDDKVLSKIKENKNDNLKVNNDIKWGNLLGAVRWNHVWSKNLFSNLTGTYTKYRYMVHSSVTEEISPTETSKSVSDFFSGTNDMNLKYDFTYYLSSSHTMRFGINGIYHTFSPGANSYLQKNNNVNKIDTAFGNSDIHAWENSFFAEDEFKIGRLQSNLGFRAAMYHVNGKNYFSPEPRILVNYVLTENTSLKASYAFMQQNIHLLTSSGIGITTDLWVPATNHVGPSKSGIYAVGISRGLKNNLIELSLEGYYKSLNNLIAYREGATFLGGYGTWESKVETGGLGKSYGVEILAQKKEGKTTGWVGYTLSKTTRQFKNINDGKPFNFTYDRTHDLSFVVTHQLNEKIDLSGTWVYSTGNAITLATGKYYSTYTTQQTPFSTVYIYDGVNTFRMRSYHRLDIGLNFHKNKKWGERVWNISVYNLYNRKNPYYYYYQTTSQTTWVNNIPVTRIQTKLMQKSFFPFIPSVSYSFRFK